MLVEKEGRNLFCHVLKITKRMNTYFAKPGKLSRVGRKLITVLLFDGCKKPG